MASHAEPDVFVSELAHLRGELQLYGENILDGRLALQTLDAVVPQGFCGDAVTMFQLFSVDYT